MSAAVSHLRRSLKFAFRQLPATSLLLLVAAALYAVRIAVPMFDPSINPGSYLPGALDTQLLVTTLNGKVVPHSETSGFFQLWRGEWWRILFNGFHHGGLLHLLMNAMLIWTYALLLERRLGSLRFFAFFLTSVIVSLLPELALGHLPVGLSGAAFAMFGMLLILRRSDPFVAKVMSPPAIAIGFGWLFLCFALTELRLLPVANQAHCVGLLYGALIGWLSFEVMPRRPIIGVGLMASAHGLAALCLLALMQPVWSGRYQMWRAHSARDDEALVLWQRATTLDPALPIAWQEQITMHLSRGEIQAAWTAAIRGTRSNRSDQELTNRARFLWMLMPTGEARDLAQQELDRQCGNEADAWRRRFDMPSRFAVSEPRAAIGSTLTLDERLPAPRLDVHVELDDIVPGITQPRPVSKDAREVNPDDPQSARLGDAL